MDCWLYSISDPPKSSETKVFVEKIISETSLLIQEDVSLLNCAFDHQSKLDSSSDGTNCSNKSIFSIIKNIILYILPMIICIEAAIIANTNMISFTLSLFLWVIIIALCIICIIHFKRNSIKGFNELFKQLIKQINDEKQTYKKLHELIIDNWNYSDTEIHGTKLQNLKNCFRDVGLLCLSSFRDNTLLLKDKVPLKKDVDDNLISSLPDDLYDSFKGEEDLNMKALKSLRQLIRLQISEFFKRILLSFIRNYYDNPSKFDQNYPSLISCIDKLSRKLIEESQRRQFQLKSAISFHKSFYTDPNVFDTTNNNDKYKTAESRALWAACRNVRKSICTANAIIDECEVIIDQNGVPDKEAKSIINSKLEKLYEILSTGREITLGLQKTLNHQVMKHTLGTHAQDAASNEQASEQNVEKESNHLQSQFDLEVPQQNDLEIFEAFIEDDQNIEKNKFNNTTEIDDLDLKIIRDVESNLFWELKSALKDKAIEHKVREAKALGLQVDLEQLEQEYDNSSKVNDVDENHKQTKNRNYVGDDDNRIPEDQNLPDEVNNNDKNVGGINFEFNFNIAMQAANQIKLRLNVEDEEKFGDQEEEKRYEL